MLELLESRILRHAGPAGTGLLGQYFNNRDFSDLKLTRTDATVRGPIPLPTAKHRYTVIRGPHIDKDSRAHFEMRVHKRLIDIVNPNAKTIDSLQRIELPAGVDIEIKIQAS